MDRFAAHSEIRKHEAFACTMVWKVVNMKVEINTCD